MIEKKKNNFNWYRLIYWFIGMAVLIVLILWLTGQFQSKVKSITQQQFIAEVNRNSKDLKDNEYFKEIQYDRLKSRIYVSDNKNGTYQVVVSPRAFDLFESPEKDLNAKTFLGSIKVKHDVNPYTIDQWRANDFKEIKDGTADFKDKFAVGPTISHKPLYKETSTLQLFFNGLISTIPLLVIWIVIFWLLRKSSGMGSMLPASTANPAKRIKTKNKFSDVAGQAEAKEEVKEVVDFLKRPGKYLEAGARIPKGILLSGPPGTGKTLIAKATAGEAQVPFYFISASNFVEMFVGLGAKRVRKMFQEARKNSPSILFIDELDAIGRKRGSSYSSNDEREQTLNQILVEMDGMKENESLLIIAATNRVDVLDPALLRPGRFDRTINVNLPDIKERKEILELHAKGKRIAKDVDFANIAKRTPRFSGAQLENIINEATLLSVREDTHIVTLNQIDEAIDRVMSGPAKKHRVITPKENRMVAIHEAGHAVIGLKVSHADIVQKITIIPRGQAGGYTLLTPAEEKFNYSKTQLMAKIVTLLGGRAAEQVEYGKGEVSTGAADDIQKATQIARAMVTEYGMSELGPIAYGREYGSQFMGMEEKPSGYSQALAEQIDNAIKNIILEAEKQAVKTIEANKKLLYLIADELIEKETIVMEEIQYINEFLKRPEAKSKKSHKKPVKHSIDDLIYQSSMDDEQREDYNQKLSSKINNNDQLKQSETIDQTPKNKPSLKVDALENEAKISSPNIIKEKNVLKPNDQIVDKIQDHDNQNDVLQIEDLEAKIKKLPNATISENIAEKHDDKKENKDDSK